MQFLTFNHAWPVSVAQRTEAALYFTVSSTARLRYVGKARLCTATSTRDHSKRLFFRCLMEKRIEADNWTNICTFAALPVTMSRKT
ncbi:hypothetical protein H9L39_03028 [Fusarium oxysporum f. sp. albedinis]|nr:hypothetical protein H9L39_03028 [Fusarium oxysporum f. sp. albedinis]